MVNVLGLVLGMAVATGDSRIVATAGLAALLAESISMAGVAFTSTSAERALGDAARERLAAGRATRRTAARWALLERLRTTDDATRRLVADEVETEAGRWLDEIRLDRDALAPVRETRPVAAAAVVGIATAIGSSIPLLPFVLLPVGAAVGAAVGLAAVTLIGAGWIRAGVTGGSATRAAGEMVAIGLGAALAGFVIGIALRAPSG